MRLEEFLQRDTDEEKLDAAVRSIKGGWYDAIHMACFNKQEGSKLLLYMKTKYPDIKIQFTWNVFTKNWG